jgi:hypothetical protein
VALTEKLRNQAGQRGHNQTADLWARKKAEVEQEAEIVRKATYAPIASPPPSPRPSRSSSAFGSQ